MPWSMDRLFRITEGTVPVRENLSSVLTWSLFSLLPWGPSPAAGANLSREGAAALPGAQTLNSKHYWFKVCVAVCYNQHISAVESQHFKFVAACQLPITGVWIGSALLVLSPGICHHTEEMLDHEDPNGLFSLPFLIILFLLSCPLSLVQGFLKMDVLSWGQTMNLWVLGSRSISPELSLKSGLRLA